MAKMVILDRDGVVNHTLEDDVTTVEGWDPIAGSIGLRAVCKTLGRFGVPPEQVWPAAPSAGDRPFRPRPERTSGSS